MLYEHQDSVYWARVPYAAKIRQYFEQIGKERKSKEKLLEYEIRYKVIQRINHKI